MSLNRLRPRYGFRSLKKALIHYAPANIYMSALNWLMPERVGKKAKGNHAYPVGGEYVVDIDANMFWRPHSHFKSREGVCIGCLRLAYDNTYVLVDKILENYDDVRLVFSGKRGFHIHVLDFNLRDWTRYNERNPIKSHEVAGLKYTRHLKAGCGGFDRHHYTLSVDPMRVISLPESLNARTGLICRYIGGPREFEELHLTNLVRESSANRFFYSNKFSFMNQIEAHPEPHVGR